MQKIKNTSREGDFVHNNQVMGTKEGFKNVSKIWLDKCMSYEDGINQLAKGMAETKDIYSQINKIEFEAKEDKFVMEIDGQEFIPNDWAISQIASWVDMPSTYAKKLKNGDVADRVVLKKCIENGIREIDSEKKFLFRTRKDGSLRAMLSSEYKIIDNVWFMEVLVKNIPGGLLSHWKGDSDTIYGNILIPDTIRKESDSDYGGMLSIGNSEIGIRRLSTLPSTFRAICMNGCIWGQKKGESFAVIHKGKQSLDIVEQRIVDNLNKQIPLLPKAIDSLLKTKSFKWDAGSILPLFAQIAKEYKMSKTDATEMLNNYNIERKETDVCNKTLFGVINAITRTSQTLNSDEWVRFDVIGGELAKFSENEWNSLVKKAKILTVEETVACFASELTV